MSKRRFTVVDLGTQLDSQRRFAVWDVRVSRFWKINGHQTWAYVDDLVTDFKVVLPVEAKSQVIFLAQRDDLVEQAFLLGFARDLDWEDA
jgi:hypothetical protein